MTLSIDFKYFDHFRLLGDLPWTEDFPERDFHEKVVFVKPDVAGIPHAGGASFRCSLQKIGFLEGSK